ncbi:MAG: hypothetical protein WAM54_03755 [Nitrososphaeraceae archaeon]
MNIIDIDHLGNEGYLFLIGFLDFEREKRNERRPVEEYCYEIYGAPSYASQMSPLQQSVVCSRLN